MFTISKLPKPKQAEGGEILNFQPLDHGPWESPAVREWGGGEGVGGAEMSVALTC